MKMSFIPSKLGLRTHPLTQINLGRGACCRGEGEICIVCCFSTPPHVRPDDQITKEALSRFPQRRVGLEATRLRQPATSALTSESRRTPPGFSSYCRWPTAKTTGTFVPLPRPEITLCGPERIARFRRRVSNRRRREHSCRPVIETDFVERRNGKAWTVSVHHNLRVIIFYSVRVASQQKVNKRS